MGKLQFDADLAAEVAHRLNLREPNRRAVETVALRTSDHYDVQERDDAFECIVDSATGVGKTYVMAGILEYLAGTRTPARNFLLLTPGRTIRDKSIKNFTPGNTRSITESLNSGPFVVTADNFNTQATVEHMTNPAVTKLFVFTVQALTSQNGEGRATHEDSEWLGTSLFKHLQGLDDLVILADEQHCYRGPAFSKTIRDLSPQVVVGLTATPSKSDEALVVFRYPLAQAIADGLVKAPVIVARRDDRNDVETKLLDGVTLLSRKAEVAAAYALDNDLPPINPVMLVIAKDTAEANEYQEVLDSEAFDGGAWIGRTLVVHSNLTGDAKEKALADLDGVEDPDSPVRIIISVAMLKEGWDVKNVYVIASMRASASEVMTEQTLGRGLRLPFGSYTGIEFLDTLEVLAHEKYAELLKKKKVLNEKFIDYATFASLNRRPDGTQFVKEETILTSRPVIGDDSGPDDMRVPAPMENSTEHGGDPGAETPDVWTAEAGVGVVDLDARAAHAEHEAANASTVITYRTLPGRPDIVVPKFTLTVKPVSVSLNEIHDYGPFTRLGANLASNYADDLRRTKIVAKTVNGLTEVSTAEAEDQIRSAQLVSLPLSESEKRLIKAVMQVKGVRPDAREHGAAKRIVAKVIEAMGSDAESNLSTFGERCAHKLSQEVTKALNSTAQEQIGYEPGVELVPLNKDREATRRQAEGHADGSFDKRVAFGGWSKNLYSHAWFDSEPEFKVANALDDSASPVAVWARLHINDVPITWNAEGRQYNPDFVALEDIDGGRHGWLIEVKGNDRITSKEVADKKRTALRWANEADSDPRVDISWGYLLLSEDDIDNAQGNWDHLKAFGR